MKIEVTKEWCMTMAQHEADAEVGAGLLAVDPVFDGETALVETTNEESRVAFGRFVSLMRRKQGLSIEKLAENAGVDIGEIMSIEEDVRYTPDPRTIYQLATVFHVPQGRLMELSGLTQSKDVRFVEEAVRYAARSESIAVLTTEEQAALDGLISVLSKK